MILRVEGIHLSPKKPPGDGWVLIGDAFGFLDPLYSSGVLLALTSGGRRGCRTEKEWRAGRHVGSTAWQSGRRSLFSEGMLHGCVVWCAIAPMA